MEVLEKFGINYVLLGAQIVNFLIILFIVKKYALKPILQTLEKRRKTIEQGLKEAEEARVLLEQASTKEQALLKKAHDEAKTLLEEAKSQRETSLQETEEKVKKLTDKMLDDARAKIESETMRAQKELAAHVSELAITLIEQTAGSLFSAKDQKSVIESATKNLKKKAN